MKYITDDYFGKLKLTRARDENLFILEKKVQLGLHKDVQLYLENDRPLPHNKHIALYKLISDNVSNIIFKAEEFYLKELSTSLLAEFKIDFLILHKDDFEWELWLIKKRGFESCIIEFQMLNPFHMSFSG